MQIPTAKRGDNGYDEMSPHHEELDAGHLMRQTESLRRMVLDLVRDDDVAEDILQETRLLALSRAESGVRNIGAWLRGVARNLAFKSWRSEARRTQRPGHAEDDRVVHRAPMLGVRMAHDGRRTRHRGALRTLENRLELAGRTLKHEPHRADGTQPWRPGALPMNRTHDVRQR